MRALKTWPPGFGVKANGEPIDDYHIQPGPVKITYTLAFEEEQARISEGLSFEDYEALPGTTRWIRDTGPQRSKCHVLMRYRISLQIPAVAQDAQEKERKRQAALRGRSSCP